METRKVSRVWRCAPAAVLGVAGLASPAAADVVYDSYDGGLVTRGYVISDPGEPHSHEELASGFENDAAGADLVTLAGTARFVTDFSIDLVSFNDNTTSADVTLTLYTNSGGLPGSVLWSGTVAGVDPSAAGTEVSFAPMITVADTLIFGVSLTNIVGQTGDFMGFRATVQPPVVGESGVGALRLDSTTMAWEVDPFAESTFNIQARITAIPAPGLFVPGVIGLAAAWRRR